ncbi:uncharacterized protein [Euwallacea fornicatus]|uniref:uncharacterized protein isoform X1 n=1 Tax=Euwallacea fornicatus TaxID=995702 RepID=UPI00338DD24E
MAVPQNCKILQLSDCAMMYILSYLDATSLFNLSRTCQYFKNIVEDPQLWRYIEARQEPNSTKKVNYVCNRIHNKTSHILLKAESKYMGVLPQENLIGWNRLDQLTVLALENQRFDGRSLTLKDFPRTLEELSLKKTYVKNGKTFFQSSFSAMDNLKVLVLDECDWLDSNFFMSIAKYPNLEILSVIRCMRLHLNIVPYLNVARHGCKKLKLIDTRFNTVANDIVSRSHKTVVAMYLQSMSSYELDTGRCLIRCPPLTIESQDLISQSTVKNHSLGEYKHLIGVGVQELPRSILYQDPYPPCSCGWEDKADNEPCTSEEIETKDIHRTMPVDDHIDFNFSPQRFICNRHMKELNTLPKDFKNFFYQSQKKFYPDFLDSSDNDSDSDEDRDCCMFGVGKSQMIVLKVREADEQGNIPEPEVIDIFRPGSNIINIDININDQGAAQRRRPELEQPSTSRQSDNTDTRKRRASEDAGSSSKKQAVDNNEMEPAAEENRAEPVQQQAGHIREHQNAPARAARVHIAGGRSLRVNIRGPNPIRLIQEELLNQEESQHKISLRRLSLRGYRGITDEALVCVQNLNLELLDVTHTAVTRDGVAKFLTLNPNCRVLHPSYCVCKPRIPCL